MQSGDVVPGKMLSSSKMADFSVQIHYRFPDEAPLEEQVRIEDIEAGLKDLVQEVRRLQIQSIAVPPLGCGLGGLDWREVRPLIEAAFASLPEVKVLVFEPKGTPEAKTMPVGADRPR